MPDETPIVLQRIDLDIVPGKIPPIVHVSEYDTGRSIIVNLFRDGYPFGSDSIESYDVKVEGTIGKYGFSEDASWADDAEGVVVIHLTEAMTAIHGRVWTKIKLIKSESMQISTCGFWLDVDRAGVNAQDVIEAKGFTEQIAAAAESWLKDQGFTSPTVSITPITGGNRVTFTDAEHPQGQSIDVLNGKDGEPGKDGDFILPSGGQAGQALISDGEGGAEWENVSVEVDATLTEAGEAADAKAVGDALAEVSNGTYRKPLREVNVPLVNYKYGDWSMESGTNQGIAPTLTPYKIRVNNTSNSTIGLVVRFLDGADVSTATIYGVDVRGKQSWYCPAGEQTEFVLEEYGRTCAKYIQMRWTNYPKPNPEITFIYDDNPIAEPKFDDSEDAYLLDFQMRWAIHGTWSADNYKRLLCIVPFYPNTWYYVRNGYVNGPYSTDVNGLFVAGLVDDSIFDIENFSDPQTALFYNASAAQPTGYTIYKQVIESKELVGSDNTWMRVKTKSWEETKGCKYLVFGMRVTTSALGNSSAAMTEEAMLAEIEALKAVTNNTYVSRFNQYLARTMDSRLVLPNPLITDNVTSYQNNPLWGAKWVLFGDSLTDSFGGHDLSSDYFAAKVAKEFGMSIDNRAKDGSNINTGVNQGTSGVSYTNVNGCAMLDAFLDEIEAGTVTAPDYVTIAFGTNGFANQIGNVTDTSANKETTCGAVKYFIEKLQEKCPNASIGFVLPPEGTWEGVDSRKDIGGTRAAIKSVLQTDGYRVPYIDMSTQSGITLAMMQAGDGIHIRTPQTQNLYYHAIRRFVMGL